LERLKILTIVLATALVTCALTSAFWLVAFNRGAIAAEAASESAQIPAQSPPPKPPATPGAVVLGPSGLAIPVAGVKAEELLDTFTQARSGGRVHDAIDIMAPHGTPVIAAAPGTVEKLFFSKGGGGVTAYVRSPDRKWTYYYAHLQDYAPGLREGATVRRGDPIGRVGSTGNANPAGPHLHFAINRMEEGEKWYQGAAINPYPLLAGHK
jgi:murein DD-endopeptidase MepM/ murein hydrolase activator NlpD